MHSAVSGRSTRVCFYTTRLHFIWYFSCDCVGLAMPYVLLATNPTLARMLRLRALDGTIEAFLGFCCLHDYLVAFYPTAPS